MTEAPSEIKTSEKKSTPMSLKDVETDRTLLESMGKKDISPSTNLAEIMRNMGRSVHWASLKRMLM